MNQQDRVMLFAGVAFLALHTAPAAAQGNDGILLDILRQCARIDDMATRISCYDRNIGRDALVAAAAPSAPAPPAASEPTGFGVEALRDRPQPEKAAKADRTSARVTAVVERGPGIYLITLEDNAVWQFSNSAPSSYDPPRKGSTVEIRRGALGSFLLRHQSQPSVRVQRIR